MESKLLAVWYVALLSGGYVVQAYESSPPPPPQAQLEAGLREGEWPTAPQQTACVLELAAASPEFSQFFGAALLLGSALTFGPEANATQDALAAAVQLPGLMNASMAGVHASFVEWAHDALDVCGAGHLNQYDNASDAGSRLLWWTSIDEQVLQAAVRSNRSEMSPQGRRLLASLRNILGLELSDEAAAASGMALGIVSGLATGVAATVITGIAMAALPGVGLAAGVLIGAGVAFIAQKSLDDIVTEAVDFFEDDTTVMQGFQQGQVIGGLGSALLTPVTGLPKLDLFLGKTGVVKVFKGWRSEAELVRRANWKVTKATWKALATQANPAATERQIAAAWRSERDYFDWAVRLSNTARANSANYLSDGIQDGIGIGISTYQEYEALRKLATLGQMAEGQCIISPHTLFNVWPEMKLIAHVQDVESAEECCSLCDDLMDCTLYFHCRADAPTCNRSALKNYTDLWEGPYSPGDCTLVSTSRPERYKFEIEENHESTPWDCGVISTPVNALACDRNNRDGALVNATSLKAAIFCPRACMAAGDTVWGTGVYTAGSPICLAAIHAGVLSDGGGAAMLYFQPGQPEYRNSSAHGVTSSAYGEWPDSFSFEEQPPELLPPGALSCAEDNQEGTLVSKAQPSALIICPAGCLSAGVTKTVWGTGIYSSGSPICLAAIHTGALTDAGGTATLYYQPGQPTYRNSSAHGVTSSAYGEWADSFSFEERPLGAAPPGSLPCSQDNEDGSLVSQGRPSAPIVCPPGCLDAGVVKPVWGTGVYTSGSPVCLAAIHAGVLTEGGGTATLYYQPGQPTYRATFAHGIASSARGEWAASFSFEEQPPGLLPPGTLLCDRDNEDGSLVNPARLSAQIVCPPGCLDAGITKTVWGTDVYTSGSPICLAAIHSGVLTDAGGTETLYYQPGQPTYAASSAHGVTSSAYGEWAASFSFAA